MELTPYPFTIAGLAPCVFDARPYNDCDTHFLDVNFVHVPSKSFINFFCERISSLKC
jgi:hypothetical protein